MKALGRLTSYGVPQWNIRTVILVKDFCLFFCCFWKKGRAKNRKASGISHFTVSAVQKEKSCFLPDLVGDISFIYMMIQSRYFIWQDTRSGIVSVPPISVVCVYLHQYLWLFETEQDSGYKVTPVAGCSQCISACLKVTYIRELAEAVAGLLPRKPVFNSKSLPVGFVMGKVELVIYFCKVKVKVQP